MSVGIATEHPLLSISIRSSADLPPLRYGVVSALISAPLRFASRSWSYMLTNYFVDNNSSMSESLYSINNIMERKTFILDSKSLYPLIVTPKHPRVHTKSFDWFEEYSIDQQQDWSVQIVWDMIEPYMLAVVKDNQLFIHKGDDLYFWPGLWEEFMQFKDSPF